MTIHGKFLHLFFARSVVFLSRHPKLKRSLIFISRYFPPINRRIWDAAYNLPPPSVSEDDLPVNRKLQIDELRYLEKVVDFEGGINRGLLSKKEILIYSPGKTGTVSMFYAINRYFYKITADRNYRNKMLHSHNNNTVLANVRSICPQIDNSFLRKRVIIKDLVEYKRLLGQSLLIVSSFREPLARGISGVFENISRQAFIEQVVDAQHFNYDRCKHMLRSSLRHCRHPVEDIEPDFFKKEQFDKDKKFLLVDRGHYKILMVCLEHSDRWQEILETELGFKGVSVSVMNRASDKKIAGIYKDFKNQLRLPVAEIKKIYYKGPCIEYLKWFYTEEEIAGFYKESYSQYGQEMT